MLKLGCMRDSIRPNLKPFQATLEKILEALDADFMEVFNFQHHNNNENLKAEIQQILDNNPDRMQDFYKIAKALIC